MNPVNLIICLDGTANSEYILGVSRIRRSICSESYDGETRQVVHYQGGIGTSYGWRVNLYQQGVGGEIERSIIEAYTFLCDNYHADSNDQIFLVGFSRGSFAARCLADLVHQHGVLPKARLDDIHELYRYWSDPTKRGQRPLPANLRGPDARITACALWDTVGAVGVPLIKTTLLRGLPFVHSDLPGSIQHVFHAIALHEHRHHFFPVVLRHPAQGPNLPTQLEQCWFAGYHADVGGSNQRDALAHFALVWMISKLRRWINFDTDKLSDRLTPQTTWKVGGPAGVYWHSDGSYRLPVTDSMGTSWKVGGSKHRIPQAEYWNDSGVYERGSDQNIVSWEKIHPTARYLSQVRLVNDFHSAERLNPVQPQQHSNGQQWIWNLRRRAESWAESWGDWGRRQLQWFNFQQPERGGNEIHEDRMDDFERAVLRNWTLADHLQLDGMDFPPGAQPPNTILVHLRAWLGNYMERAVPVPVP